MKSPSMNALKTLRSWGCLCAVLWAGSTGLAADPLTPEKPPTFSTSSKEPVLLRYQFKTGQVMKCGVDMAVAAKTSTGGQNVINMGQDMRTEFKISVTGVDEKGNIAATIKTTRMKLEMTGLAKVSYDSDNANDADEAFKAVTAMINVDIPIKFSPVGEILETDLEPLRLAARKAGDAAMAKSIEDSTKKMFGGTFVQLSAKPIAAGENYQVGTVVDDKTKIHLSYDILSVSGDKKQVVMAPKATFEMADDAIPGAERKIKSQDMVGWRLFDVENGLPGDSQMKIHIVFDMKSKDENSTVDVTTVTKVSMKVE